MDASGEPPARRRRVEVEEDLPALGVPPTRAANSTDAAPDQQPEADWGGFSSDDDAGGNDESTTLLRCA